MANRHEKKKKNIICKKTPSPEFWEKQCAKWLPPSCTWVQRRSFTTGASARLLVIYLHFFSFVWLRHNKDVQSPYGLKQWHASHSVWLSRTISEEALTNKFLMGWFFFPRASMCFESGTSPLTQHYSSQIQSLPSPCLPEVFLSAAFSKHAWSFSFKIIFNPSLGNQDQPTLVWARKEQPGPTYSAAPPSQTLKLCLQAPLRVRLFWFIKPCQGPSGALPVLSKFYMFASTLLAWAKS